VVDARPAPGQAASAATLRGLLSGGSLAASGGRRLQDPLSFRCVSQVHGSLATALDLLADALEPELNGAGDNPLVLAETDEIVSTGNFFVPVLALAADAVALALAQVAALTAARTRRLLAANVTDLPQNLAPPGSTGAGMAPLLKVAEALAAEIVHGSPQSCRASLERAGDERQAACRVRLDRPERAGSLRRLDLGDVRRGYVERRPVEHAVRRVLAEVDLLDEDAVGRDHGDALGDRR